MELNLKVFARQDSLQAPAEGVPVDVRANKMGQLVVMDFYTQMAIEGRCYQVRAGTLTTPLTGDINVTTVKCEMTADAALGTTIIPTHLDVDLESFAGGTIPECGAKSVGAVSSAGAAYVPLPLLMGGAAAASTARVAAAGGCTVAADAVTTTRWHFSNRVTAQADFKLADHEFTPPPVLVGPACFYVVIAATTAGPVYFAHFDYIELPTAAVS